MIKFLSHRLVALPWVYDAVQRLAGVRQVQRRLRRAIDKVPTPAHIVDVGGGTGVQRTLCPTSSTYICLDIDPVKLIAFHRKYPSSVALMADALTIPIASDSIDLVLCTFVSHHIADESVNSFFKECARILRPSGQLIVTDPVWKPDGRISRILWRYDRGSHPRTASDLERILTHHAAILDADHFTVFHSYALFRARKYEISLPRRAG